MNSLEKEIRGMLAGSENIFDVYLYLYYYFKKREASVMSAYEGHHRGKVIAYLNDVASLLRHKDFTVNLSDWSEQKILDKLIAFNDELALFALFWSIDLIFGERDYEHSKLNQESFDEKVIKKAHLNSDKTKDKALVFPRPVDFISKFLPQKP